MTRRSTYRLQLFRHIRVDSIWVTNYGVGPINFCSFRVDVFPSFPPNCQKLGPLMFVHVHLHPQLTGSLRLVDLISSSRGGISRANYLQPSRTSNKQKSGLIEQRPK